MCMQFQMSSLTQTCHFQSIFIFILERRRADCRLHHYFCTISTVWNDVFSRLPLICARRVRGLHSCLAAAGSLLRTSVSLMALLPTLRCGALLLLCGASAAPVAGCRGRGDLLAETGADWDLPSDCVLSCTALTYQQMLLRQDARTVRFKRRDAGELGEYCWSTQVECNVGDTLREAYIVVPVESSEVRSGSLALQVSSLTHMDRLGPHRGSTLPEACGLHFDVTAYFRPSERHSVFCVQTVPKLSALGVELRCPPFLVTVWQKMNHSPINQGGG